MDNKKKAARIILSLIFMSSSVFHFCHLLENNPFDIGVVEPDIEHVFFWLFGSLMASSFWPFGNKFDFLEEKWLDTLINCFCAAQIVEHAGRIELKDYNPQNFIAVGFALILYPVYKWITK